MKTFVSTAALIAAIAVAGAASAQPREVAGELAGGLDWAVAAPQGAAWTMECRFRPVTIRGIYQNRLQTSGTGPQGGRLPTDNGSCTLTKTGGEGTVGVALVKDGKPTAAGSNGSAPAVINVF